MIRKMVLMGREQTCSHLGEKGRVGKIGRVALTYIHCLAYNRQLVGSCGIAQRARWVLCDDLEGWNGEWGSLKRQGIYIYI